MQVDRGACFELPEKVHASLSFLKVAQMKLRAEFTVKRFCRLFWTVLGSSWCSFSERPHIDDDTMVGEHVFDVLSMLEGRRF
jgi:hypothetical protein